VQLLVTDATDHDEYSIADGVDDFYFPPTLYPHDNLLQQRPAGSAIEQLGSDNGTSSESVDQEPAFGCVIDKDLFGDGCWGLEFADLMGDDIDIEGDLLTA
jgi:hypothetical protein